ncbi:hypothetical protein Tco_0668615, partial [Tanacetum coccineum]
SKIPESPWGSPIPIGDGDGDVNRFPDGDGDEAEKRGWGEEGEKGPLEPGPMLSWQGVGVPVGPVFLLGLLALAIDAACAFRAEEMPSLISCWMAAKVMAGVSDVECPFGRHSINKR